MYDFAIVGGGIVGLATGLALGQRYPMAKITILEKEASCAAHQTGHNSGVIHSGIYYTPGSFKARFCQEGNRALVAFCEEHGIDYKRSGKVIVATEEDELPRLEKLYLRGRENGLPIERLDAAGVREIEPHVSCLGGIKVPTAGVVDYKQVSRKYLDLIQWQGGTISTGTTVDRVDRDGDTAVIITNKGEIRARTLINCAGLYSDRLARRCGLKPEAQIVPFRGEYYELKPEKSHLVNSLIYPVPDPEFPFLGVHFTRGVDGHVHAGPNAVLGFKREGYRKLDFDPRDFAEIVTYPGLWKLFAKHAETGLAEMYRSWVKSAFVRSMQRLIPEITGDDIAPMPAGVRAQALSRDCKLVSDFLILEDGNDIHVCNAPSPAATSSLAIGRAVADRTLAPTTTHVALSA